ncbi:MAG: hypothetical protein V2A77_05700 [Pseudomonadota bacterium]
MRKALDRLAEQILSFDEASLTSLLDEYRRKMDNFEASREWERAVIIFFIINSVRVKNLMFNENVLKNAAPKTPSVQEGAKPAREGPGKGKTRPATLKLVK